ncbi:MAG TPA: hypothetical protein VJV79_36790 [Polyangiaceae bacterium]|nr:hypothetical protein [Polyangiaceae bacterium]
MAKFINDNGKLICGLHNVRLGDADRHGIRSFYAEAQADSLGLPSSGVLEYEGKRYNFELTHTHNLELRGQAWPAK